MPDSPPYCSIPKFFGKKFATWCESKFSDDCHTHDVAYGSLHPKTGTRADADAALRKAIYAKGYPILAFGIWLFLRLFYGYKWKPYTGTQS